MCTIKYGYFLLALLLIGYRNGVAQTNYSISPSSSITFSLSFNQNNEAKIYQVNTSANKLLLKWKTLSINLPSGWAHSSCDYGACYGSIPNGPNTMDSIGVGGQGFIGIDIDPSNIAGTGEVKVYIYEEGNYNNGDTLTWSITTNLVGIEENFKEDKFLIYPNPTSDFIKVIQGNNSEEFTTITITDQKGNIIKTLPITGLITAVDLADLISGTYYLLIQSKRRSVTRKLLILKENY